MRVLDEMLAEKREQLARIQTEIATLEAAVRRHNGEPEAHDQKKTRRANVKGLLLDLLQQAGPRGLNAASAVDMAARMGQSIERGTASSLLSRLKFDKVVQYDGNVYRLSEFTPTRPSSEPQQANVINHPASKGVFG